MFALSAEGDCKNSQAKRPDWDETLESSDAPKKQLCHGRGIFKVLQQRHATMFACYFIKEDGIWNKKPHYMTCI